MRRLYNNLTFESAGKDLLVRVNPGVIIVEYEEAAIDRWLRLVEDRPRL
jgi:hypothetical protein